MTPGPNQHSCKCESCPGIDYYLDPEVDECFECDLYTHTSADGLNCTRCTELSTFDIIDDDGFCMPCEAGYYPAPVLDNCDVAAGEICFPTACKRDVCDPTLYTIFDAYGRLNIQCGPNEYANDDCSLCTTGCDPMPVN